MYISVVGTKSCEAVLVQKVYISIYPRKPQIFDCCGYCFSSIGFRSFLFGYLTAITAVSWNGHFLHIFIMLARCFAFSYLYKLEMSSNVYYPNLSTFSILELLVYFLILNPQLPRRSSRNILRKISQKLCSYLSFNIILQTVTTLCYEFWFRRISFYVTCKI